MTAEQLKEISLRIRTAPNAKALNNLLPDHVAVISSAPRLWTVQVDGQAMGFPESFADARARVAAYFRDVSRIKALDEI